MEILKKLSRRLSVRKKKCLSHPPNVLLEVTNACNLRCRMCFIRGEGINRQRETGFVREDIWRTAIDEIASWPGHVSLDLHGAGEPLLHPDFFTIAAYAKSKKNITVGFLSNATLLSEEKSRRVMETGIDWAAFSVDGAQKDVFEHYRTGADLDEVEANIERLLSLRRDNRPAVIFNTVSHQEIDVELFINRWKGKVDVMTLTQKRPPERHDSMPLLLKGPCPLLQQQLVMCWNGLTGLCCEDFWCDYTTGKFPEQSLCEIWNGDRLARARELHARGEYRKIDLCRHCDAGELHGYDEEVVEHEGRHTQIRRERP